MSFAYCSCLGHVNPAVLLGEEQTTFLQAICLADGSVEISGMVLHSQLTIDHIDIHQEGGAINLTVTAKIRGRTKSVWFRETIRPDTNTESITFGPDRIPVWERRVVHEVARMTFQTIPADLKIESWTIGADMVFLKISQTDSQLDRTPSAYYLEQIDDTIFIRFSNEKSNFNAMSDKFIITLQVPSNVRQVYWDQSKDPVWTPRVIA